MPSSSKETLVRTLKEKASEQKDLETEHELLKTLTETDLDTEFLRSMHHVGLGQIYMMQHVGLGQI